MPALIERPKMSLAMWAALKSHIMKQREKKKQEQEADAAIERLRREQEMKRKQDAMTLEEIKEQLAQLEQKHSCLKEEKHQLFLQLKKVLHEDDNRRRAMVKEANDVISGTHSYPPPGLPVGGPPPMYMIGGGPLMNRTPVVYKVGAPPQQNMLPTGAMKRPRSPSPPPQSTAYQPGFSYKTHVTAYGQKGGPYQTGQTYYSHTVAATGSGTSATVATTVQYPGYSAPHPAQYPPLPPDQTAGSKAHIPPHGYPHITHLQQQGYVGTLHQQLDHANQKSGFSEEKYYVQQPTVMSMRSGVPVAGAQPLISIQQPKPGGITSGFPIRTQQPPTSAPHYQPPTSNPSIGNHSQNAYGSQQNVSRHAYSGQPTTRYY